MIQCGIDGLTRGIINEEIMVNPNHHLISYVPLNLNIYQLGIAFQQKVNAW